MACTSTQKDCSEEESNREMDGVQPEMTHSYVTSQLDNMLAYLEQQFDTILTELMIVIKKILILAKRSKTIACRKFNLPSFDSLC